MQRIIGPSFFGRLVSIGVRTFTCTPKKILVSDWQHPKHGAAIAWTVEDRWILIHRSKDYPFAVEFNGIEGPLAEGWFPRKWETAKVVPVTSIYGGRVLLASPLEVVVVEQWQHRITGQVPVWRVAEQWIIPLPLPSSNDIMDVVIYYSVQDMTLDGWTRK